MIDTTVNTNEISLPAKTIVGYRRNGSPIYNIAGGSIEFVETGTDADAEDPLDDDDDDDEDEEEDAWAPPSKEEWDKLRAEKSKADSESAARKRFLREHGINPKNGEPLKPAPPKLTSGVEEEPTDDASKKSDTTIDAKQIEKNLQRQMERTLLDQEKEVRTSERGRAAALIGAIPEALNSEGWNGKAMPRILKLLDLDALEVDTTDGEIEGLEEQIRELKADFPEFFKRARMKDAAKEVSDKKAVGGGLKKTSPANKDMTWAERIAFGIVGEG